MEILNKRNVKRLKAMKKLSRIRGSPVGRENDNVEHKKVPPSDKFYRLRILLLIIGITSSLPMKFFITSNQYWMHKFRNPEAPNDSKRTELQANFTAASMAMQTIPSILTTYLALRYAHKWKIRTRIMLSLLLVIACFLFSTVFIKINTDKWQTGFFILTMTTLTFLSIISSILRFTLTVLISRFPQEYVKFYTIGHGTTGLLSAILQIIALSLGREPIRTALIYFLCGTSILTVALLLFYLSKNLDLYQFYMNSIEEDTHRAPYRWRKLKPVMWKMMPALTSIFTYEPTVYMFHPNLTNLIKSEYYWNGSAWSTKYFTPVITFLYSDALSLLGRSSGMPIITKKNGWIFILVCLFKMLGLAPLLAFCNAQTAHRHLPVWFPHDWQYILILGAFSYLSGFLLTSAYISIPNLVGKEVEKAYPLMQVAFTSITALSPLGILIVNVI